MVMLFVKIRFLIMSLLIPKLMFTNQFGIKQKFNGIVQSSTAYTVLFVFHHDVKTIYIKMFIGRINFFQNGVTLRRFPVSMVFQKMGKNLFYYFVIFLFYIIHNLSTKFW